MKNWIIFFLRNKSNFKRGFPNVILCNKSENFVFFQLFKFMEDFEMVFV